MVQISSQSPLQHIERVLLNNIQARDLMKMEREREHMDEAKKRLFENHTNMKRDFDGIKRRSSVAFDNGTTRRCGEQQGNYTHYQVGDEDGEDDDDDDDFEYEEKASNDEAVVFVAEMMTVRRFPPGSAKLVDIPPHNSNKPPTSSTSNATQTETPRIVYLKEVPKQKKSRETNAAEDENANGRVKWGNSLTLPTPRTPGTTRPFVLSRLDTQGIARYQRQPHQLSPLSPYRSPKASHAHRRKARLDPSQNLLAGWIDSDSSTASRPLSFVADPDGLADQALDRAPTPPPKDPRRAASTSTTSSNSHSTSKSQSQSQPQPQTHSPERHHCVKGGHIFDAIDLEQAPDDIRLNRLDVNPFLHTPEGKREEVKIPVTCENWGCGVKCEKVVWRCRIPACRLVVCGGCQSRWEGERRGRAVGSWEGDQGRDI